MKKLISLLVCFAIAASLCVPVFAANETSNTDLPPDIISPEGGTWIPASEDGIAPHEDPNDACGISSHLPPSYYRYVGCYTGDSSAELKMIDGVANIVGKVPGVGTVVSAIQIIAHLADIIDYYEHGARLTTYYEYIWGANGVYWYHIVWAADLDGDGYDDYITCSVQTAP